MLAGRGFILLALLPIALYPHDPITTKLTWTQEISRIVYKRCAGCHRPGGSAFSLLTYEDARPWAKAIRDQVRNRTMPPWSAVKGVGEFSNDHSLSEPEIDMLISWVEGGAPNGEPAFLPPLPTKPAPAAKLRLLHETTLQRTWKPQASTAIQGLRVPSLKPGDGIEIWITRKDGSTERLLWIQHFQPLSDRTFTFRQPVRVNVGDVITSTHPAVAVLSSPSTLTKR